MSGLLERMIQRTRAPLSTIEPLFPPRYAPARALEQPGAGFTVETVASSRGLRAMEPGSVEIADRSEELEPRPVATSDAGRETPPQSAPEIEPAPRIPESAKAVVEQGAAALADGAPEIASERPAEVRHPWPGPTPAAAPPPTERAPREPHAAERDPFPSDRPQPRRVLSRRTPAGLPGTQARREASPGVREDAAQPAGEAWSTASKLVPAPAATRPTADRPESSPLVPELPPQPAAARPVADRPESSPFVPELPPQPATTRLVADRPESSPLVPELAPQPAAAPMPPGASSHAPASYRPEASSVRPAPPSPAAGTRPMPTYRLETPRLETPPPEPAPDIVISIGHIEVRAAQVAERPPRPAFRPRVSLDDFLNRRPSGRP